MIQIRPDYTFPMNNCRKKRFRLFYSITNHLTHYIHVCVCVCVYYVCLYVCCV